MGPVRLKNTIIYVVIYRRKQKHEKRQLLPYLFNYLTEVHPNQRSRRGICHFHWHSAALALP